MARGGGGEGEEGHPLRCLDAVRYAVASMVTVLILIVVVKATKVVLFPDSLYVAVFQGSIWSSSNTSSDPPTLLLELKLRIDNPRRRVYMHYVNVTTYLFDNDTPASSSDPEYDSIVYFRQDDTLVRPEMELLCYMIMRGERNISMDAKFFDLLYNNKSASMSGMTMRMDAMLLTESGRYNTSRRVSYYCWPLVIQHHQEDLGLGLGLGDEHDVFCRDVWGSHFI